LAVELEPQAATSRTAIRARCRMVKAAPVIPV
jgi:hypothetical protein